MPFDSADQALCRAKASGKGAIEFAEVLIEDQASGRAAIRT